MIEGSQVKVRWYHQEGSDPAPLKAFYPSLNNAGRKHQQTIDCSNILDVALDFKKQKGTGSKRMTAKSVKKVLAAVAAYHVANPS